jgi:nitrite reductase/ring-hydroxylating ferredoxin subunit
MLDPLTPERFVKVARLAELEGAPLKAVTLLGKRVAILRRGDGGLAALEMSCKHQGADLTAGRFEGGAVTCPRHGWRYDLETGECLNQPLSPPLRRHAVRVEGDAILVCVTPEGSFVPDAAGGL